LDEIALMVTLANQAALAIENARLQTASEYRASGLAQQAEELARSNADLEQFAYVASHDLQKPLRDVTSYIQLFVRRYGAEVPEQGQEFLDYALDGMERMRQLIQDLLAYSRVGTRGRNLSALDSGAVFQRVVAGLDALIEETGATITAEPLPVVRADETQLDQLLQNLISNAIKFHGSQPPRIHVSVQRQA